MNGQRAVVSTQRAAWRIDPTRDSEIQNLHAAFRGQHDVFRFQVAMGDAERMSGREAVGDLYRDIQQFPNWNWAAFHERPQRFSVDEFADHVVDAIGFAKIEDGNDVRVVQRRNRLGLDREACPAVRWLERSSRRTFTATSRPKRGSRAR